MDYTILPVLTIYNRDKSTLNEVYDVQTKFNYSFQNIYR